MPRSCTLGKKAKIPERMTTDAAAAALQVLKNLDKAQLQRLISKHAQIRSKKLDQRSAKSNRIINDAIQRALTSPNAHHRVPGMVIRGSNMSIKGHEEISILVAGEYIETINNQLKTAKSSMERLEANISKLDLPSLQGNKPFTTGKGKA